VISSSTASPTGALLAAQARRGAELVGMARMVGDQGDFNMWRHRRDEWVRVASMALAADRELDHLVARFRELALARRDARDWLEALEVEVEAAATATDLLRSFPR
jgi:hypothetical protein